MLHGNGNDPRIQGESSGWVEAAAKHTIILTSIEWQGRTAQEITFDAIGEAGTMMILDRLLVEVSADRSRPCYFTGLSAGAMNSYIYGVNNLKRIAGVAGHSAPFGPPNCSKRPQGEVQRQLPARLFDRQQQGHVQAAAGRPVTTLVLQRHSRFRAAERYFRSRRRRTSRPTRCSASSWKDPAGANWPAAAR